MPANLKNEQGGILVYVLLLLMVLSSLGLFIMNTAISESKMGNYCNKVDKSYLLADAASEIAAELIYEFLAYDYANQEVLPTEIMLNPDNFTLDFNLAMLAKVEKITKIYQDENKCIYKVLCVGDYYDCKKKIELELLYEYTEYYNYTFFADGSIASKTFAYRIVDNRGEIIAYYW